MNHPLLIDTDTLQKTLGKPELLVIDVRGDAAYEYGGLTRRGNTRPLLQPLAQCRHGLTADRHDPCLAAFAGHGDQAGGEVEPVPAERREFGEPQPR